MKLLTRTIRRPYSLYEVVEVKPGVGMTLFDLFRRTKYQVVEHAGSQTLKNGDIVYCATADFGGISSSISMSPFALRPTAKRDILELRKWMIEESERNEITDESLDAFG